MDIPDLTPTMLPLQNSAEANAVEAALKQQFLDLFMDHLRSGERELNVSGMPHLGPIDLIERHVKLDGLALIRTDEPSMKYLYRAWKARNPKRGMHFLRTYLQLLWPNGWIVNQMWQDKNSAYPTGLSARSAIAATDPHTTHYLTSRIRVLIDDDSESGFSIPTVVPALRSVVAAKFVLEIQLLKRFSNIDDHGLGLSNGATAQNMAYFDSSFETQQYSTGLELGNGAYSQNFMYSGGEVQLGDNTPPSLTLDFAGTQTLDSRITFSRSTVGGRFNSSLAYETVAANTPRFDYDISNGQCKGLLIERASANAITNNTAQGASVGNFPTHWTGVSSSGITSSVVGTGTESGIPYVDIRCSGTPTSSATLRIVNMCELGNQGIPASVGDQWVYSMYAKLASGSLSGVNFMALMFRTYKTGALVSNVEVTVSGFSLASGSLSANRTNSTTAMPSNTAYFTPSVVILVSNGVPIDFTIRIGLPQCELGHRATSAIKTTSGAVSRDSDNCYASDVTGWFNSSEGTFVLKANIPGVEAATNRTFLAMSDGSINNALYLSKQASSLTNVELAVYAGAAAQAVLDCTPSTVTGSLSFKAVAAYKVNDFILAPYKLGQPGVGVVTDTAGSIPALTRIDIGKVYGAVNDDYLAGTIAQIIYYPHRMTNAKIQALLL